jgi:hypothetical protein
VLHRPCFEQPGRHERQLATMQLSCRRPAHQAVDRGDVLVRLLFAPLRALNARFP